jgi:hypothetical protein
MQPDPSVLPRPRQVTLVLLSRGEDVTAAAASAKRLAALVREARTFNIASTNLPPQQPARTAPPGPTR